MCYTLCAGSFRDWRQPTVRTGAALSFTRPPPLARKVASRNPEGYTVLQQLTPFTPISIYVFFNQLQYMTGRLHVTAVWVSVAGLDSSLTLIWEKDASWSLKSHSLKTIWLWGKSDFITKLTLKLFLFPCMNMSKECLQPKKSYYFPLTLSKVSSHIHNISSRGFSKRHRTHKLDTCFSFCEYPNSDAVIKILSGPFSHASPVKLMQAFWPLSATKNCLMTSKWRVGILHITPNTSSCFPSLPYIHKKIPL